ncbi:hypothetical protein B7494_g8579 [Chlorociboria aeruginascens]|nr:hypothetical protein B7494_g8579 [Chlorociboria aeruginascens]
MAQPFTDRSLLAQYLQSQQVSIPDLRPIFEDWPGTYQENLCPQEQLQELRRIVDAKLQSLHSSGAVKSLKPLRAADFASFTVLWWPHAALEEQRILAYVVIWLFTWDDEIDEPTGSVADDFQGAERYREETEQFVKFCLQLSDKGTPGQGHPIVQSFRDIGDALCGAYDAAQRERFFAEISMFMRMSKREQDIRLQGKLPSLDQYWEFRMGTSAVYIGVSMGEFANRRTLPKEITDSKTMRRIWDETNVIISITNDLLSLRKEIRLGCVDSVVPLTCATGVDVEVAIQEAVRQLEESKRRLDEAAVELEAENRSQSPLVQDNVRRFIRVCQTNCTGNLIWSLSTARYGMAEAGVRVSDGKHSFALDTKKVPVSKDASAVGGPCPDRAFSNSWFDRGATWLAGLMSKEI